MLTNAAVICFLGTKNPSLSREFYKAKLGFTFVSEDHGALVFRVNVTMLRIQKVEKVDPKQYTVLGWDVADIQKEVSDLTRQGIVFERYKGMKQDDLGIWNSPAGAKVAWFRDPDGNVLSLTQF